MAKIKEYILSIFFPRRCALCRKVIPSDYLICDKCERDTPLINLRNFLFIKRLKMHVPYTAPFSYKDKVRLAIHRLKFRKCTDIAEFFADRIYNAYTLHREFNFDLITFVPMYKGEEENREYNQTEILALMLSKKSGVPYCKTLVKNKANKKQHTLTKSERIRNVKGVYACIDTEIIKDKKILIIDDVITTGSTILECTDMLYKGGAAVVECACAAKV